MVITNIEKFLVKCRECKKMKNYECDMSDFEDKSCAFVYKHLKSEGISYCDVFEKREDKK